MRRVFGLIGFKPNKAHATSFISFGGFLVPGINVLEVGEQDFVEGRAQA